MIKAKNAIAVTGRKKLWKRIAARWQLYLVLLAPIVFTIVFNYVPMAGVLMAFQKYNMKDGLFGSPWVGLLQFEKFLSSPRFGSIVKNTLTLSLYGLFVGYPITVLFALLLNAMRGNKYKKVIQTVTYLPHFISTVVIVGLVFQVLNYRNGLWGALYQFFNGTVAPDLLAKGSNFKHIHIWSGIWQNLGFDSILFFAALAGIDTSLHEAATIDGANRFQRLKYIDLPGIIPIVSITLILRIGGIMNVGYEKTLLMQNDLNSTYSEVISTYVYKVGLASGIPDYSYSTAIGLFNSVINYILLLIANKISSKVSGSGIF